MKLNLVVLILVLHIFVSEGYDILILIPYASKSLHILFSSIGMALAQAGHDVTFLTSFKPYVSHPNIKHVTPKDFMVSLNIDNLFDVSSHANFISIMIEHMITSPKEIWSTPKVQELYRNRHRYDAILTTSIGNEAVLPFIDDYQGTFVVVCTPGIEYNALSYLGNWASPAVVPHLQRPYDEHMTYYERILNSYSFITEIFANKLFMERAFIREMRTYFPDFKSFREYYQRNHLTLINGHFTLDDPVPLLPNQIEIGTINAKKAGPLPKDLQQVFDHAAPEGVIYFSLGSFVPGKAFPKKYKDIFIEAFRRLPHTIIWKYDEDDVELPPNVITRKWLPQEDILGHPKTKIFISHCGNLGTQEAKFHGVPVLAVPIAYDQPRNAARLMRKGYGVIVNWDEMSVDTLLNAVFTLTNDTSYYERMKNISRIVQDQKDSPAERAVWWIEYVIRHEGAPHLRYAGQRLSFLQYIMLDVVLFWLIVFVIIITSFVWLFKALWRKIFRSKKAKKE